MCPSNENELDSFYLDSSNYRGKEIENIHVLDNLIKLDLPKIEERVTGIEKLVCRGHLSLQKGKKTFVFDMAEEGEEIPSMFLIRDTESTLGFHWHILWNVEDVQPVPDFIEDDSRYFTMIKGTATIITDTNQDDWFSLISNSMCTKNISIY